MSSKRRSKTNDPFYKVPDNVAASSQIINDAKTSLRSLKTKRPFTPRDEKRSLFGPTSNRPPEKRPPSVFSLGPHAHFDGGESRPVSGKKLAPLDAIDQCLPKPPPNRCPSRSKGKGPGGDVSEVRGEGDGKEAPARTHSSMGPPSPPKGSSSVIKGRRSGPDISRKDESPEDAELYNDHINPVIETLAHAAKAGDTDEICDQVNAMYTILESRQLLGKACRYRGAILKSIYKLLDQEEPHVLLRLARIILALKVTGNNLTSVSKLVFKVSRNEKNDHLFLENNILDLVLETINTADFEVATEALVYCVGSVKFLSGNSAVSKQLVKLGTIETLGNLLQSINKLTSESNGPKEQMSNILVQVTGVLRNLADVTGSREKFISCGQIDNMSDIMKGYGHDSDLMLNVSRLLSKLTLHADCCSVLSQNSGCFGSFLQIVKRFILKQDLVVRICFILGNLTARSDDARLDLFQETESMEILLSVLKTYMEKDRKDQNAEAPADSSSSDDTEAPVNTKEDVLVKVVRVIANISINENVGADVACNKKCIDLLLKLLDYKHVDTSEELVLNTIATINNLSYYPVDNSAVIEKEIEIADVTLKTFSPENMDALLEVARVYGNLTRHGTVRDFLMSKKVAEMMVTLLDSGSREVVYIACGVLINFMADDDKRTLLSEEGGIKKLLDVLRDLGKTDWQLASMVCQVLWNYSSNITSSNACFGEADVQELNDILIELLDGESSLNTPENQEMDDDVQDLIRETWETEFCPKAAQLLKRIESHQSDMEKLDPPT